MNQKHSNNIFKEDLVFKKTKVDWDKNVGKEIRFKYKDIEGIIKIIELQRDDKNVWLTISYKNKISRISGSNLLKCKLGKILGEITSDFKIEIGQEFKDEKRDLIIIDREYRKVNKGEYYQNCKFYKYKCRKCSNEDWIEEHNLLVRKQGCNNCFERSKNIQIGVNDIATTDPWMIKFLKNKEDAYSHTHGSSEEVEVKCPDCGKEKLYCLNRLDKLKSIACSCSDNTPYTEKFIFNLLQQLNINFIWQYSKVDCKWIKNRKEYDFYFEFNNEKYIIEVHGEQHYRYTGRGRSLKEEQENDIYKYNLAISNEIKSENYIVIDFRYSTLEWGKEHILNSRLNEIFDLSIIDWLQCEEYALKNIIKEVCDYWDNNKTHYNRDQIIQELMQKFNIKYQTIRNYLKKGTELGWCLYTPYEPVFCFEMGEIRLSSGEWKRELGCNHIKACCDGKLKQDKGYTFRYATKEEIKTLLTNSYK